MGPAISKTYPGRGDKNQAIAQVVDLMLREENFKILKQKV